MSKVIGIDLGTTNSVVAIYEAGKPRIIPNPMGGQTMPSVVAFTDKGEQLVGAPARNQQVTNPANTIYSIKRFMGRRHCEVEAEEKIVPYRVVGKTDEYVEVLAGKRRYKPQEISAMILRELKESAEHQLGEAITRAVITVPAYFNDAQRQATLDAGRIAGLKVERIINEPTAAALAYGFDRREDRRIAVVDFGGGTFDLAIMDIGGGKFKVLAVHGNTHLGGDDFDQRIIDIVADDFRRKERIDLRRDPMALQRLKEACEKAKTELSSRTETTINLPFIIVDGHGPRHLQHTLERGTFEQLSTDLFEELRQACIAPLAQSGIQPKQITDVIMVGGSTRIPKVQEMAREIFRTEELDKSINPDEVVALGAAILGGVIAGELQNVNLMDVTSRSLGVETVRGGAATLVEKNTAIPTSARRIFSTPKHNQTSVPIRVLEGEGRTVDENRTLALFQLKGIPKAPAGKPKIEVKFDINSDGILRVSATDTATGKSQEIVVKGAVGLEQAEIERMQREAKEVAEAKGARRAAVGLRNHAEEVLGDLERWLQYNGRLMPPKARTAVEASLKKLERNIDRDDREGMKVALRKLDEVMQLHRKAG